MTTDLSIGSELGEYRIEAVIGRGGMGVVYRAEDLRLGRKVALKVLAPELVEDPGFRARFDRESRLAAAIDHPNIIPLYEAREIDGLLFITMRYVEGTDLRAVIAKHGRLEPLRAVGMVGQVAGALDAAHQRGLVHRDVKPANVLVASGTGPESSEHCYLTDFGLTKDTSSSEELTEAGQFVGTLEYVAPEQIESNKPDGRADVYALACVLYECLTGVTPFRGDNDMAVMYGHLQGDRPLITEARGDLPKGMDDIMVKALAREPDDRYATCGELVADVRNELRIRPSAAPAAGADATRIAGAPAAGGETRLAGAPPAAGTLPGARAGVRPRGWAYAAAGLAVIVAAVAGALAGGSGGGDDAPEARNVAAAGKVGLRFPADWAAAGDPGIEGLKLSDPLALAPRQAGARAGLVAGRIADHDARLLPSGLAARLSGAPKRDAVVLGRAQAFRYRDLRPRGFDGSVTLYAIPTDAGIEGVACYAPAATSPLMKECEEIAATLTLAGATPLGVQPSPAYARGLSGVLKALATARDQGRRSLAQAKTALGQAAPAAALASAYRRARQAVTALEPPELAKPLNGAIGEALSAAATAYERLAGAARDASGGAFSDAKGDVKVAEEDLARALAGLAGLGYTLGG